MAVVIRWTFTACWQLLPPDRQEAEAGAWRLRAGGRGSREKALGHESRAASQTGLPLVNLASWSDVLSFGVLSAAVMRSRREGDQCCGKQHMLD